MADPVVLAVPAELLAAMVEAQRDGVTVMREARAEAVATREAVTALRKALDEHATREEPALAAFEAQIKRFLAEDTDATAEARAASKRAEATATKEREKLRTMAVQIVLGIGGLIIAALAGAGGYAALGGP